MLSLQALDDFSDFGEDTVSVPPLWVETLQKTGLAGDQLMDAAKGIEALVQAKATVPAELLTRYNGAYDALMPLALDLVGEYNKSVPTGQRQDPIAPPKITVTGVSSGLGGNVSGSSIKFEHLNTRSAQAFAMRRPGVTPLSGELGAAQIVIGASAVVCVLLGITVIASFAYAMYWRTKYKSQEAVAAAQARTAQSNTEQTKLATEAYLAAVNGCIASSGADSAKLNACLSTAANGLRDILKATPQTRWQNPDTGLGFFGYLGIVALAGALALGTVYVLKKRRDRKQQQGLVPYAPGPAELLPAPGPAW